MRLYQIVIVLALVVFVAHSFQPRELQKQADSFLEEGRFLEALSTYEILTDEQFATPWRAQAFLRRGGILLLFLDDFDTAEKELIQAIHLDPEGPLGARAYFRLGMQYHQQSRYEEAANSFRISLELEPGGVNAPTAEFLLQQSERLARLGITSEPETDRPSPSRTVFLGDTDLRIAIARNITDVRMTSDDPLEVVEPGGSVVHRSDNGSIHLQYSEQGITVDDTQTDNGILGIRTDGEGSISFNDFDIPTNMKVEKTEHGLVVVARVPVEEYLRGVVPKEMPASWHEEALKAQAVCARTYALYQKQRRGDYSYDLLATVASQVYGGEGSYHPRSDSAVAATRGEVLMFEGDLALTLFHANSGGHTEDMKRVWGSGLPYLEGVKDPHSPVMEWSCEISQRDLEKKLKKSGIDCDRFSSLAFSDRGISGRYRIVTIICGDESVELRTNKLRHIVGPGEMKSTRFREKVSKSALHLAGEGFGHGVGLSQWGARGFAEKGALYEQILSFYYPGTTIGSIKARPGHR